MLSWVNAPYNNAFDSDICKRAVRALRARQRGR